MPETTREQIMQAVISQMMKTGWPSVNTYCADVANTEVITYRDKIEAERIYKGFLEKMANKAVDFDGFEETLYKLGALAKHNVPKALFLLGEASEGGETVKMFPRQWPVLPFEPERKMIDAE